MAKGRYLAVVGLDGAGKTSVINNLLADRRIEAHNVKYVWFRFSHMTSLPVLAASRLIGATRREDGQMVHRFSNHGVLAFLYPRLLYVDMWILSFFKIRIPLRIGRIVVLDRCTIDSVVDLSIDLGDSSFISSPLAQRFFNLLPGTGKIVMLDISPSTATARRPSLAGDSSSITRRLLYSRISQALSIPIISNDGEIEATSKDLKSYLEEP